MKKTLTALSFFLMLGFAEAQTYQPFTPPGGLSLKTNIGRTSQTISDLMSLANGALPANNGIRTGGSDTGTDVSAATVNKSALSSFVTPTSGHLTVFLGGANHMDELATNVDQTLGTSRVGLYEHANGLAAIIQQSNATLAQQQIAAIQATWAKTGASIVTGGGTGFGEIMDSVPDAGYMNFFGGKYPEEVAADLPSYADASYTATSNDAKPGTVYSGYLTADAESKLEVEFSQIPSVSSAKMVEPFFDARANIDDPVATSAYYANWRTLVIHSGGFAMDVPPQWALQQGSAFVQAEAALIKWGVAQGLGVTLVVSPYNPTTGNCGYQANFLDTTRTLVGFLMREHALPTQYAVENYCQSGDGTVNTASGDDVTGSLNQVALWLASQPVSVAGSTQSIYPGTLPQNQLHLSPNANPSALGNRSYSVLSNLNVPMVDLMNQIETAYGHVNDMAYQGSYSVAIKAGSIGDTTLLNDPLNVYLNTKSSFLTAAPLTFQGSGPNGNQTIQGGSDQYLHLGNPYNAATVNIGLKLGTDSSAPLMYRFGNSIGFAQQIYFGNGALFQGGSQNPVISGSSSDGYLHITNPYSTSDWAAGIYLGAGSYGSSISVSAGGTVMQIDTSKLELTGRFSILDLAKADILAIASPGEGEIVNDSTDHVPVIYENGAWYPIQLGAALQ